MAHAESRLTIERPVQKVFDFLLDGTHNPLWRPGVIEIQRLTSLPDRIGSKFKQGLKGPGGRIDGHYEIVELNPDTLCCFLVCNRFEKRS